MKIDNYVLVYSGLNEEPYYAAAAAGGSSIWAAASGNIRGAAHTVIDALEDMEKNSKLQTAENLRAALTELNTKMARMKLTASAAGAICDGSTLQFFNIGNARAFLFTNGYLSLHTDDHTEAYESFIASEEKSEFSYDAIRFDRNRTTLKRALGLEEIVQPQFYPPVPLIKDTALLVCTDSFWHYLNVMEMELDYRKSAGPEEWLKIMSRRVLMKAGRELDEENFAAVAAMVEE